MALRSGRELNLIPQIDELLMGEGADEDTQAFHRNTAVSDPHPIPFKGDVLSRGIGGKASPLEAGRGEHSPGLRKGHFGSTEAKGQGCSLTRNKIYYIINMLQKHFL
jgi:hypothetical protein